MAWAARYIPDDIKAIAYGTDVAMTATPGSFTNLMAREIGIPEATRKMVQRLLQKPYACRGPEKALLGPMAGKATFKINMRGGKLAAGTGAASEFVNIAQYCGFTKHHGAGGSGKITGGSASTLTALDADVSTYVVGDMIIYKHSTSVFMRRITGKASTGGTTTLTFTPSVSSPALVPASGDSFYPIDTLIPTIGDPSYFTSLNCFRGQGATDIQKIQLLGGVGKFKFPAMKNGDIPIAEFEYMFDRWAITEAAATQAADLFAAPRLILADSLYLDNDAIEFESIAFDPGTEVVEKPGSGANGRIGWFYTDHKPKIEIVPYWDLEWATLWAANTSKKVFFSSVEDELHGWGFAIPEVQIQGVGQAAFGGLVAAKPALQVVDPHFNTDLTPVAHPPFCIGVTSV